MIVFVSRTNFSRLASRFSAGVLASELNVVQFPPGYAAGNKK